MYVKTNYTPHIKKKVNACYKKRKLINTEINTNDNIISCINLGQVLKKLVKQCLILSNNSRMFKK